MHFLCIYANGDVFVQHEHKKRCFSAYMYLLTGFFCIYFTIFFDKKVSQTRGFVPPIDLQALKKMNILQDLLQFEENVTDFPLYII
jgi:hypothetical protein